MRTIWLWCTLGENAEIRLNAYPNVVLKGRISNIGAILDPNIRTAKVRVEVENPGMMRLGMFVQATFRGQQTRSPRRGPGLRHPAPSRPRLGLCAARRPTRSAAWRCAAGR